MESKEMKGSTLMLWKLFFILTFTLTLQNLFAQSWGPVSICSHSQVKDYSLTITSYKAGVSDGTIIAWNDYRPDNQTAKLYIQKINSSGTVLWISNGVEIDNNLGIVPALGRYAQLVSDSAGGVVVVYNKNINDVDYIYSARVNSNGNLLWGPLRISGIYGGLAPRIIYNSNEIIITWFSGGARILAQKLSINGSKLWEDGIIIYTRTFPYHSYLPTIVPDGLGGAIINWLDTRNHFLKWDLYAQRLNASGELLWNPNGVLIFSNGGSDNEKDPPDVATTWNHNMIRTSDGAIATCYKNLGGDVCVAKVTLEGEVPWGEGGFNISNNPSSNQVNPLIVPDGADGACILWEDYRVGNVTDIYGNRITNENPPEKLWGEQGQGIRISEGSPGQYYHYLANVFQTDGITKNSGSILIPWHSYNNNSLFFQPRGISRGQVPQFFRKLAVVSNNPSFDFSASSVTSNYGDPLAVLVYRTSGNIYAKGYSVGWPQYSPIPVNRNQLNISTSPNPFNPATKISYTIPEDDKVSIKVIDMLGRTIATLVNNEFKRSGSYQISFEGQSYPSGVYFLKFIVGEYTTLHKLILLK